MLLVNDVSKLINVGFPMPQVILSVLGVYVSALWSNLSGGRHRNNWLSLFLYNHTSIVNPNVKIKSCFTLVLGCWIQIAVLPQACSIPVSLYSCSFKKQLMRERWKMSGKKIDSCNRSSCLHSFPVRWLEMLIQTTYLQTLHFSVTTDSPLASTALKSTYILGFVCYIWFSIFNCSTWRGNS